MGSNKKLDFLEEEIVNRILDFRDKRIRDKKTAFRVKMMSILLSAIITVLLGIKVNTFLTGIFSNLALIFGATITVVSAFDAFYNHRSLWVQRTITLSQLYALQRDINLYKAGDPQTYDDTIINGFINRFNDILKTELHSWLKLREETPTIPDNKIE